MNNELKNEKTKQNITQEHDCHQSPEDGCEVCSDRSEMGEREGTEDTCEYCGGEGEITTDIFDPDSGQWQPTGTEDCICKKGEGTY